VWFAPPAAAAELELELVAEGFDLSADTDRAVRRILSRMISADEVWLRVLLPPTLSVRVTLVQSEQRYREHEARAVGRTGHTLGFFVPALSEATIWRGAGDETMRRTLVHEASHFLLAVGGMGRVPLWLNEGLAEVYESARVDGNAVWLVPDPTMIGYVQGRPLPKASELVGGGPEVWTALGPTPWSRAEYPYGWALCAMLISTEAGRETLAELLSTTAMSAEPGKQALEVVQRTYPGGADGLERAWTTFVRGGGATTQLPIRTSGGQAQGWGKCPDGTLVRMDSGARCGSWIAGPDGLMRYVEQAPVAD
jgi:hypothetical protein